MAADVTGRTRSAGHRWGFLPRSKVAATVTLLVVAVVGIGIGVAGPRMGRSGGLATRVPSPSLAPPVAAAPVVTCGRIPADACEVAIDLVRDTRPSEVAEADSVVVDDTCPPDAVCDRQYPFDAIVVLVPVMGAPGDWHAFGVWGTNGPEVVRAWQGGLPPHVVALIPRRGTSPTSTPESDRLAHPIVVSNATDRPITLGMEGVRSLTVPANDEATIPSADAPLLPFRLEVRLASGHVIGTHRVVDPRAFLLRIGLTCGGVDVWSASTQPVGPRPDPADDIDCDDIAEFDSALERSNLF